jgi:hypothetical protein
MKDHDFDRYCDRYENVRMKREEGNLEVALHTREARAIQLPPLKEKLFFEAIYQAPELEMDAILVGLDATATISAMKSCRSPRSGRHGQEVRDDTESKTRRR